MSIGNSKGRRASNAVFDKSEVMNKASNKIFDIIKEYNDKNSVKKTKEKIIQEDRKFRNYFTDIWVSDF